MARVARQTTIPIATGERLATKYEFARVLETGAANVQISASSPNFPILESIQTWGGFHGEILKHPMERQDGYVIPPSAPGLGVELDEEVAAKHPYEGKDLHLDMHEGPL